MAKAIKYPGKSADVSWHGRLCIHIGECGQAQGDLFVGGRKPWCQPDVASDDEVEEVVLRCPTGALSYDFADGSRAETASSVNTVQVAYNGPLFVRGDLNIEGAPADAPGLKFRAAYADVGNQRTSRSVTILTRRPVSRTTVLSVKRGAQMLVAVVLCT